MKRSLRFILLAAVLECLLIFGFTWLWRSPPPLPITSSKKINVLKLNASGLPRTVPSAGPVKNIPSKKPMLKESAKGPSLPASAPKPQDLKPSAKPQGTTSDPGVDGMDVDQGGTAMGASEAEIQKYLQRVLALVARKKYYPRLSRENGEEGVVIVQVKIARSGEILRYALTQSSPYIRLNQASQNTLNGLRLPPLPEKYPKESLSLEIPFRFRLQ